MTFQKRPLDARYLDLADPEDQVFLHAAEQMREAMRTSVSKKQDKMFVAEIIYKGMRHEVWLNRHQIRARSWRENPKYPFLAKRNKAKGDKALGGYIKAKCLGLD